jgi:hypothetical protein
MFWAILGERLDTYVPVANAICLQCDTPNSVKIKLGSNRWERDWIPVVAESLTHTILTPRFYHTGAQYFTRHVWHLTIFCKPRIYQTSVHDINPQLYQPEHTTLPDSCPHFYQTGAQKFTRLKRGFYRTEPRIFTIWHFYQTRVRNFTRVHLLFRLECTPLPDRTEHFSILNPRLYHTHVHDLTSLLPLSSNKRNSSV